MGVWGRVGYATLSIDDRQFISGIYYWHGVCGDLNFTQREEIINCFINIFNQMDNNCFPFGHNTRTDTAGCQVTLYILCKWLNVVYI